MRRNKKKKKKNSDRLKIQESGKEIDVRVQRRQRGNSLRWGNSTFFIIWRKEKRQNTGWCVDLEAKSWEFLSDAFQVSVKQRKGSLTASKGQMSTEKHLENMGAIKSANMQQLGSIEGPVEGGSHEVTVAYVVFVMSFSDWLCKPERASFLFLSLTLPFFFYPFFTWQMEMMYRVPTQIHIPPFMVCFAKMEMGPLFPFQLMRY